MRHDGETGGGVEVGGGLRYTVGRLGMEGPGRALVAHEGGIGEWGASGSLGLLPRPRGEGLSVRVGSSLGAAGSGLVRLWSHGLARRPDADDRSLPGPRTTAELGYGFGVFGGLLTPYGGMELSDGDGRRYRLGARFGLDEFDLDLEAMRRENARGAHEHAIGFWA